MNTFSNAGFVLAGLLQALAAWHLLCAVSAYWLFDMYASVRRTTSTGARLTGATLV